MEKLPLAEMIYGIGDGKAATLQKLGIETLEQLILADTEELQRHFRTGDVPDWQTQALKILAEESGTLFAKLIVHVTSDVGPVAEAEISVQLGSLVDKQFTADYGRANFLLGLGDGHRALVGCVLPEGYFFADGEQAHEQDINLDNGIFAVIFEALAEVFDDVPPDDTDLDDVSPDDTDLDDILDRVAERLDGAAKQAKKEWKRFNRNLAGYLGPTRNALDDIALGQVGNGAGYSNGGLDGSAAAKKVDAALAKVLGRPLPVGTSDTATLRAVLSGTFPEDPDTGKILRQPVRTYVTVVAGNGYLAADQSILSREVHLIANEARTELESLRSIATDTDEEEAAALTELILADLDALIAEAARMDRPREPRVADILDNLDIQVIALTEVLGLDQDDDLHNEDLVTSEEAQLVAGAKLLERYIANLRTAYVDYFASPAGRYPLDGSFSGRLAVADMQLAGIANSVADLRQTLANAGLSQVESQTTYIKLGDDRALTLDGILNWIEDVAGVEGPERIARSGRLGLRRVHETAQSSLAPLVELVLKNGRSKRPAHPALRRLSVQQALTELAGQLQQFTAGNPAAAQPDDVAKPAAV